MRELIQQEMELEELFQEVANDEDFVAAQDEEDIVDSDFDQGSEIEEQDDDNAEEQIRIEEKWEKREAARKVTMATLGPALRKRKLPEESSQSITSMPGASDYMIKKPEKKKRSSAPSIPVLNGIRSSSRRHTVESKKILQEKLKEYEKRRAQLPKREKTTVRPKTQEELLAEAKKTEEENLASLRAFELKEAQKIQSVKQFKEKKVPGPYIREISYIEGDDNRYRKKKLIMEVSSGQDGKNVSRELKGVQWWNGGDGFGEPNADKRQARKLVIFTDFSKAESTKLFEEWRKKPIKVKKVICPFTGLTAKYRDPKTGIPYATIDAYKRLQEVLKHNYVWSPILNAYVSAVDLRPAQETPKGFELFSVDRQRRDKKTNDERERRSTRDRTTTGGKSTTLSQVAF